MGKFSIEGGGHLSAMQKFGLIAPVVYQTYREPSAAAYFKATADKPILLDNGKIARIDWKTLERWYYLYQKEGYNALEQHVRVDKGTSRILNDAAIEELYRLKGEFPRMNATQIHKRLVANGYLPKCDVSVVQRFMKKHDLKCVSNPNAERLKRMHLAQCGRQIPVTCLRSRKTERNARCSASPSSMITAV